ncbi:5-adenylylsulfate reductase-like 4 [Prunus yedoensis var. nudiflora]|uniref:5-adenylylsulfate reductase-like 4 n=1 Tax=Prunus yedoensis var. nudiflora TaxID=2094558 RepID=A0A314UV30_PRUYE|nr:5-adenylylsulfate reductase-like 4 [Prunus yedoensis var. nudiflora]
MGIRVWQTGIVILLLWVRLISAAEPTSCPTESVTDAIFGFRHSSCPANGGARSVDSIGVIVGDEVSLQRALNMVHKNTHEYVAVLFYASWCPFSRMFKPTFSILASLYPSIPHFAFEESAIRPSILSKYGVHGFPTIFILNSTMRVRYQGSRTPGSLIAFYSDITGIKTVSLDQLSLEKIGYPLNHEKHDSAEQESCPFSWARSPENMLRQETYLALASAFHMETEYPKHEIGELVGAPIGLSEASSTEGAMNARVWASKSLATVSIGDASTSRGEAAECVVLETFGNHLNTLD